MNTTTLPLPLPPAAAHLSIARAATPNYVATYVEGPSDAEMWRHWLNWPPQVAGGKLAVLDAIAELEAHTMAGFFGLVDADFDGVIGASRSPNVISSEFHDLECDLLRSPALQRLLSSVDQGVLSAAIAPATCIEDALTLRGVPYGCVRWVFHQRSVEYPHGRLSPFRFTDQTTWEVREDDLYSEAAVVLNLGKTQIREEADKLKLSASHAWQVCNGHDLISLVTILLQGPLGVRRKFPSDDVTATTLRLCIDTTQVGQLHIVRAIEGWQQRNPPYAALRGL